MKPDKLVATLVHTCPWDFRGGGETNVKQILEATPEVTWRVFGVGGSESSQTYLPSGTIYRNLAGAGRGVRPRGVLEIMRCGDGEPVLFSANDAKTVALLGALNTGGSPRHLLWQSSPFRPDVDKRTKRSLMEAKSKLLAKMSPHHITFSPVCASQLQELGVEPSRITQIPQILHPSCDRSLRENCTPELDRDKEKDALRILVVSRIENRKGVQNLPHFLRALDAQLSGKNRKVSLTLMGHASHGEESKCILNDIDAVAQGLTNVQYCYSGYRPPEEVYKQMARSDLALSFAGTEGYSVSLIEGLHLGLPIGVQPVCAPNVDVISRSKAGWVLSGDAREDAQLIANLTYDDPCLLNKRELGYGFVDRTTGREQFHDVFMNSMFPRG